MTGAAAGALLGLPTITVAAPGSDSATLGELSVQGQNTRRSAPGPVRNRSGAGAAAARSAPPVPAPRSGGGGVAGGAGAPLAPMAAPPLSPTLQAQQPDFGVSGAVGTQSNVGLKSTTSILRTPGSVSVITRDELNIRGVQNIESAVAYTPGILATDYAGGQGGPAFTVRGYRNINYENVYEDGLRYGFNSYDKNLEPYAYERIDVIKGPASVLYGAGQPGGIINLVSKRPTFVPYNEVFIQGGNYNRVQGGFDLSGPVEGAPDFAYRMTGLVRKSDTQVAYTPDDRVFLAPSVTWRPDADTQLTVMAKYAQYGRGGSEQVLPIIGSIIPSSEGRFFKRDLFVGHPTFNSEALDNRSVGYQFDHSFAPGWLFHSAFRYDSTQSTFRLTGVDPTPLAFTDQFIFTYPYKRNQASQAILTDNRIDGRFETGFIEHNIVAGVDYQYSIRRNQQFLGPNSLFSLYDQKYQFFVDPSTFTDRLTARQIGEQTGIYFQDQMRLGGFILTGSVRNDWVDQTSMIDSNYFPSGDLSKTFSNLSYRGGLGYEFDVGLVPYVAYSSSFNPQFDGFAISGGAPALLEPSKATQIEGGLKYQPPGVNAIITASGFEITRTNITTPDLLNPGFSNVTGEARSTGFEIEGKATLENGLTLIGGYAHIETKVTKDNRPGLVGNRLANAPENTLSLFVDYALPSWTPLWGLRAGAGVRYVGERTDFFNVDSIPAYALVDASISYDLYRLDPRLKGFTASANALNLFDKRYFNSAFYPGTIFEGFRRTVFGTLTYRW